MTNIDTTAEPTEGDNLEQDKLTKEAELEARLSSMETNTNAAQTLAKLMSDPQIRTLMDARQRGKQVEIVDSPAKEPPAEQEVDVEGMTQKELLTHTLKQIRKLVVAEVSKVSEPLASKVQRVEGFVTSAEQNQIAQQIKELKEQHPDFDQLRTSMAEIYSHPENLTIKQLYILARNKAGTDVLGERRTASERPSSSAARPAPQRKVPLAPGRQGFLEMLAGSKTLQNLDVEGGVDEE